MFFIPKTGRTFGWGDWNYLEIHGGLMSVDTQVNGEVDDVLLRKRLG
jgi:hypothetical protein